METYAEMKKELDTLLVKTIKPAVDRNFGFGGQDFTQDQTVRVCYVAASELQQEYEELYKVSERVDRDKRKKLVRILQRMQYWHDFMYERVRELEASAIDEHKARSISEEFETRGPGRPAVGQRRVVSLTMPDEVWSYIDDLIRSKKVSSVSEYFRLVASADDDRRRDLLIL